MSEDHVSDKLTPLYSNVFYCPITGQSTHQRYQSPIAINKHFVPVMYKPLRWSKAYFQVPKATYVCNAEMYVKLKWKFADGELPFISGGHLAHKYVFNHCHFHWGSSNEVGCEHTYFKRTFPMEVHLVHLREDLDMEEGKSVCDGFSVLAYFVQISKEDNPAFNKILHPTKQLLEMTDVDIPIDAFPLSDLFPPFSGGYFNYEGSLTYQPFPECVRWIVSTSIIDISQKQLDVFRLLSKEHESLLDNWRPVQPLHGRTVYFNSGKVFLKC